MKLSEKLGVIANALGLKFTLNGQPISNVEVFATSGLLPALAKRADQLCSLCLGYGIGASFVEEEGSLLGMTVTFDEVTPNILRYLCITDILCELTRSTPAGSATALDELMHE